MRDCSAAPGHNGKCAEELIVNRDSVFSLTK
jgi:hypothetical protein